MYCKKLRGSSVLEGRGKVKCSKVMTCCHSSILYFTQYYSLMICIMGINFRTVGAVVGTSVPGRTPVNGGPGQRALWPGVLTKSTMAWGPFLVRTCLFIDKQTCLIMYERRILFTRPEQHCPDFKKDRPVSKMHSGSRPQITHFQLSPITTGSLRHLHDATNFRVV